jgi:arylsulfatase A-like enzyme
MPCPVRPNILLITTDQQRYDSLGANGSLQVRTPSLDALAGRGVLFRHAYVQSPICIPSRACLQTGRYPHEHGVTYMEEVIDDTPGLPAWEVTFMERLQAAGYHTAAFGKLHMMPAKGFHEMKLTGGKGERWTRSAGLAIGLGPLGRDYAAWLEERHPGGYEAIYEQRRRPEYRANRAAITNVLPLEEYVDYWIAENTVEFLRREHREPFFVWSSFCGPHGPIDPPRPYDALYPIDEVQLPANYEVDQNGNPRRTTAEEDRLARRYCAFYWGLVTLIDGMVGRIMATLADEGLMENTLVLFTSDHGEMLGEFGRLGKGNFYESVIRVPLLVVPPGTAAGPRRVEEVVEVFDLCPTILDYAQAEVPASMSAVSLRPLVVGSVRPGGKQSSALCLHTTEDRRTTGLCVRTRRYKYVYWGGARPEQFFDLEEDPLERRNLIGEVGCRDEVDHHRLLALDRLAGVDRISSQP